jgi:hypothetical protein
MLATWMVIWVERWSSVDTYAWLAQLGTVPPLG